MAPWNAIFPSQDDKWNHACKNPSSFQVKKGFSGDTGGYLNERIMPIDCCNKQLTRACSELGIRRITNHDLRHYFGTSCLEADIPVSTVAAWMGHSDGGALLLKTYAHLRDQHSAKKAATLRL